MMRQAVDPERALIAAGIMIVIGIAIFFFRNRKIFRKGFLTSGGLSA